MANQDLDLAGLLTGISNRPQPVQRQPIPGSPNFRGMFGAQMASDLQAGVGKLVRGGAPSQAQKMQQFMSQLDLNSVEDLTKLAKIMQASGDMAGAAKVAAKIQAMQAAGPAAAEELRRYNQEFALKVRDTASKERPSAGSNPALVQEYNFAKSGGYTGTFMEFIAAKKGGSKSGRTQVIQREVEGEIRNILVNSDSGNDIKDLGTRTSISSTDVPTQVVQRSVAGVIQNVLINSNSGDDIKILGPRDNPNLTTSTISRDVNGRVHTILINNISGEDIKDLGPAKIEETQLSTILDTDTGIEHSVTLDKKGNILKTIGVSKLPTFKVLKNDDGTYQVVNETLGLLGPKVQTKEAAEARKTKFALLLSKIAAVDNTLGTVEEARALADAGATGFEYFVFSNLPFDTDERRLGQRIKTLRANLGFDKLQAMRDASPTGGALGQVSNIELDLLTAALTALDGVTSAEDFNKQLDKVKKHYSNFKKAMLGQTPDIDFSSSNYKGVVTVKDGVRYMKDPLSGEVYNIGKVK